MAGQRMNMVVFADDWGRHPSSAQHLIRHLLAQNPDLQVCWVNTIGSRTPRLAPHDLARATGKVLHWLRPARRAGNDTLPDRLTVISPVMYPGFRQAWQRRLNARQLTRAVNQALDAMEQNQQAPRIAVTTLPLMADLVGRLNVDHWVYYCVDDFSTWPATDHAVMDGMERELVGKVARIICVSQTLQQRLAAMGGQSTLLTHGIDLEHWQEPEAVQGLQLPDWLDTRPKPHALFWGLIDPRLETSWCLALAKTMAQRGGCVTLLGPNQLTPHQMPQHAGLQWAASVSYDLLPALAQRCDLLIMPYIDAPVTRAMQPLKLKEYLATFRPVVVRDLPATRPWADCCDVVSDEATFTARCLQRLDEGLPADQRHARQRRLPQEAWSNKAAQFLQMAGMAGG